MRKYLYVTKVYGNISVHAHNRADADEEFQRRGYALTDIEEVR